MVYREGRIEGKDREERKRGTERRKEGREGALAFHHLVNTY